MTNFRQLMSALEAHYPPQMAESWDQVGNHFGRPEAPVKRLIPIPMDIVKVHYLCGRELTEKSLFSD